MAAAIKAVETVDAASSDLRGGAGARRSRPDHRRHGNCGRWSTPRRAAAHGDTTNPVPLVWAAKDHGGRRLRDGGLADLAPTVLELLGLPIPAAMTGRSLIVPAPT